MINRPFPPHQQRVSVLPRAANSTTGPTADAEGINGGGIILGDRQVAISNAEIAHAQWPRPPRNGDRCVIDGRTATIQACDTRRLRNDIVLHLIQVRG